MHDEGNMTVREALAEGTRILKSPGTTASIDTPELDADLLLAEALNTNHEDLIIHANNAIEEQAYNAFLDLVVRRRAGECVAYILGRKEFRLLEFAVNPGVLVPRPDTETLVEAAMEHIDNSVEQGINKMSVLDLCTGSGAIAISLYYERPHIKISASDISKEALKTAAENAERLLGDDRAVNFIESDIFKKIKGKFNIIVCNPPYIPSSDLASLSAEVRQEPAIALDGGEDGLKYIKEIICQAKDHMTPNGVLFLEADPGQMPTIRELLENNNYSGIKTYHDLSGKERVISGTNS